jgi:O-succinylbenzoic acid--CoA ligase
MSDSRPTTWLTSAADATPDAPALVLGEGTVTYAELEELSARTASSLVRMFSLTPGTRLGVAVTGRPLSAIAAMWAAWRMGAAVMPLDPRLPELSRGASPLVRRHRLSEIVSHVDPGPSPWQGEVVPGPDDLHSMIMTSGSASGRKAVLLTNRNVAAAVEASRERLHNGPDDRWLLCLPLFHVGGLSILWRSAASGGAAVVHAAFDAAAAAAALRSGEATIASFVPTMLRRMLDADPGPYENVKAVLIGGAPASRGLLERGLDAGLPVLATYGMTEAASQIATVVPGEERASLGTVGPPLAGFHVAVDDDGAVSVDGPAVSPGYDGEPGRAGPLRTSDLGHFDDHGRLVVRGRSDDVIITGGENVHPHEVEQTLRSHPAVVDCVVYGLPDADWGVAVSATVAVSRPVSDGDLMAFLAARLAPFQVPKRWRRVAAVPSLGSGKPDRPAAREAHQREQG